MALWFVAVIVLIAVGAMPSAARAHGGAHGGHPHAAPGESRTGIALAATGAAEATGTLAAPPALRGTAVPSLALTAKSLAALACDGACCNPGCRTAGGCCTGAGLAPEAQDHLAPRGPGDRARPRARAARTDVVPEALPEPPRFRA